MRIGRSAGSGPAPDRLIVVVDNLDALAPEAAVNWIDAAQSVIGQGCIGLLAFDPVRLAAALGGPGEARRRLGKWLQVTVNLPARNAAEGEAVVARLLALAPPPASAPDPAVAAALVEPLSSAETTLLAALAPLAAHSPREAKRFLNAYRLARCSNAPRPVMALMQAAAFADDDAQAALRTRLIRRTGRTDRCRRSAGAHRRHQGRPRGERRFHLDRGRARRGGGRRPLRPAALTPGPPGRSGAGCNQNAHSPKENETKKKQNRFLLLSFTFLNRDFSKGYSRKKQKNFPCLPTRLPGCARTGLNHSSILSLAGRPEPRSFDLTNKIFMAHISVFSNKLSAPIAFAIRLGIHPRSSWPARLPAIHALLTLVAPASSDLARMAASSAAMTMKHP